MWRWLRETKKLQQRAYGVDPSKLRGAELADFVVWNHTALIKELSEFLDEVTWKPWVHTDRGTVNRDQAIEELVDVAHFLGNLAVAMGCDDPEWTRRYRRKIHLNAERRRSGYTGRCLRCKQVHNDVTAKCEVL